MLLCSQGREPLCLSFSAAAFTKYSKPGVCRSGFGRLITNTPDKAAWKHICFSQFEIWEDQHQALAEVVPGENQLSGLQTVPSSGNVLGQRGEPILLRLFSYRHV